MMMVNMLEAKTDLSKLVKKLEDREEEYIMICRSGRPVAKLTCVSKKPRIAGMTDFEEFDLPRIPYISMEALDSMDDEISELFGVDQ
jgi:antitoxin (DNA-binding transcriptional repressor) of toxin-antitoxin stability system